MIGNFIADHVKGTGEGLYEGDILRGIRLHRMIDAFTDSHPVVEESKKRLRSVYRKYAPVIVDVFYDHFLAGDWHAYHHQELNVFSAGCYSFFNEHVHLLPARTVQMLTYMEHQDWLSGYASLPGVQLALTGLSRRTSFDSNMQHAHLSLEESYDDFRREFGEFFPELRAYVSVLLELN